MSPILGVPGLTWGMLINLLAPLLKKALDLFTPMIKDAIIEFVQGLYVKAKATESPVDDLLVGGLARLLGIDLDPQ